MTRPAWGDTTPGATVTSSAGPSATTSAPSLNRICTHSPPLSDIGCSAASGDPTRGSRHRRRRRRPRWRSHFGANLPFLIGGIGYQTADYTVVSAAQQRVAQTVPNVAYFSDYDLLGPNHTDLRFDAADQQLTGQRYVTAFQALPEPRCLAAFGVAAVVGLARRRRRA